MTPSIETLPWHHQRHHRPGGGFQNLDEHERPVSLWKGLTWSARRIFHDKGHAPPPVRRPDTLALRRRPHPPERLRLTWIGHSTMLMQTPTCTLLTDPIFSDRASPVPFAGPHRLAPPALPIRDLPAPDAVLLSHDHYDHCDQASIEELHRRYAPTFFAPLGVARRLRSWGVGPVVELDWWQRTLFQPEGAPAPLRLTCAPARHFSGRSLFDRNATLWASWMIETIPGDDAAGGGPLRFYFGGDSGYAEHFGQIRARLGAPDVAILPIGAFRPRWLMAPVHIGPTQALQAFDDLGARRFVPIHWGTFDLAEETVQAPAALLKKIAARHGLAERVRVPDLGEALAFEREDTVSARSEEEKATRGA